MDFTPKRLLLNGAKSPPVGSSSTDGNALWMKEVTGSSGQEGYGNHPSIHLTFSEVDRYIDGYIK